MRNSIVRQIYEYTLWKSDWLSAQSYESLPLPLA